MTRLAGGFYDDGDTIDPEGTGDRVAGPRDGAAEPDGQAFPGVHPAAAAGSLRAWLWGEEGVAGEYLLASRSVTVGRDPESDIVLSDQTVSWEHATLTYRGGGWWLFPQVAAAGLTWVNGHPVRPGEPVPVCHNYRLRFGFHTQLRLRVPPGRPE